MKLIYYVYSTSSPKGRKLCILNVVVVFSLLTLWKTSTFFWELLLSLFQSLGRGRAVLFASILAPCQSRFTKEGKEVTSLSATQYFSKWSSEIEPLTLVKETVGLWDPRVNTAISFFLLLGEAQVYLFIYFFSVKLNETCTTKEK